MAQLEVRLEELKDQQEESVRQEDYSRAMILKTEISSIREKINSVKENLYAKPTSVCDDIPEVDEFSEENDEVITDFNLSLAVVLCVNFCYLFNIYCRTI